MDRRQFLRRSTMALSMASLPSIALGRAAPHRWGLQLFTVIAPLEQDFEGTLRQVARIGYREVETIGTFGRDPAYVRGLLDRYGLVSPSQHIASEELYASFSAWSKRQITSEQNTINYVAALQPDKAARLVDDAIAVARILGQKYIVWPILMAPHLATRDIVDAYVRAFNAAGEACAKAGMIFAFHNHAREFALLGNDVIYDIILKGTDPATVKMEMDFYWISKAKGDPLAYLRTYPNRFRQVHVKDMAANGDITVVGGGVIDLKRLIGEARGAASSISTSNMIGRPIH